jgi:PadR family transcriptional regulator PadR
VSRDLGPFEQWVLFAILALGGEAYGAAIHREIQERTGRSILIGAIYTVLDRLESRGLVASWMGEPTAERGGRRRKYYRLEAEGARRLRDAYDAHRAMTRGLANRLERLV